jgi:hypothetical protein
MDLLNIEIGRRMIIALAVLGAAMVIAGGMLGRGRGKTAARLGLLAVWSGYALTSASVVLFIVAGFLSSR